MYTHAQGAHRPQYVYQKHHPLLELTVLLHTTIYNLIHDCEPMGISVLIFAGQGQVRGSEGEPGLFGWVYLHRSPSHVIGHMLFNTNYVATYHIISLYPSVDGHM